MTISQLNAKNNTFYILKLSFLIFFFFSTHLWAQDSLMQKSRPKIGLVLSGGGAKGLAHIGVLKVLEQNNIPIDYITGTSMGSIIGALYAIGYTADEIEQFAKKMNWSELFEEKIFRSSVSIEEKDETEKYLLEISLKNGKPVIPTGLISGQNLEMKLAALTWSVHGKKDFLKFQIPFQCIATDIETGNAVVLNKGYLQDAIRASMSIPSVFTPYEIDGKLLVDGGLVCNFPVSEVKKMGADIIIGVNVSTTLYKKEDLTSMIKIMDQAASFSNAKSFEKEKELCDIFIAPDLKNYNASSFGASDSIMLIGYEAGLAAEKKLKKLAELLKENGYQKNEHHSPPQLHSIYINSIELKGLKKVSKNLVFSKLQLKVPNLISLKEIEKAVDRLYGSNYFNKVNYRIISKDDKNILSLRFIESPFSKIKIGVNYNSFNGAALLLNATFRNIIGEGSKLLLSGKLCNASEAIAEYSIFTKWQPSIGLRTKLHYYNFKQTIFQNNDSVSLNLERNEFRYHLAIVSSINNSLMLVLGSEINFKKYDIKEFLDQNYATKRSHIQLYGKIYADKLDQTVYPNSGLKLNLRINYLANELLNRLSDYNKDYWKLDFSLNYYCPIGKKFNLYGNFAGGAMFANKIFWGDKYLIGGNWEFQDFSFPLSGFQNMQYDVKNFLIAGLGLRFEPWKNKFVFIYANGAEKEDSYKNFISTKNLLFGYSVGIGMRTIIGPLELKLSKNNLNNDLIAWIQIAYAF